MKIGCNDKVILDQWHPISSVDVLQIGDIHNTVLLDTDISYQLDVNGDALAWLLFDNLKALLPVRIFYGFLWVSLGTPPEFLFPFPEFDEPDRRNVATGVFGVNVSAGRTIENFLDMGHFPYVHSGILGEEPHTEVKEYDVEVSEERDEVLATSCKFYQPQAAVSSMEGMDVDYIYRVPHINCALLYKSSPVDEARLDVIIIFVQPMGEEWVRAHTGMCIIDDDSTAKEIRQFQQTIFGQDKPILENQYPKRLPLDSRIETPIRADKSAISYRRWLSKKGLQYGVIPSAI